MPTPPDPWWGWTVGGLGAWPLVAGLVLAAIACGRELRPSRRDWLAIGVVLAAALVLRLAIGVWAPLHINGQGPLWIGAAAGRPSMLVGYGPGYPELFAPVVAISPRAPDVAIFAANAVMSACVPVAACVLARLAGVTTDRAAFAAAILVVDPIAVRFSATESYFVPIALLVATTNVAIAASVRATSSWRRVALLVAAAAFAVQAARLHPVSWIPLALCPLAALSTPAPLARRFAIIGSAALAIAAAVALTTAGWIAQLGGHATRYGDTISHQLGRAWILVPIAIAFVLGRSRHWPLVVVGSVALVADAILRPVYGQSEVWQSSFDRIFMLVPIVAIAATIPEGLFGPRARVVLTAAVAIAALVRGWPLRARTTEQLEYVWMRHELARLEPECRVASLTRAGLRVHYLPWYAMDGDETGPTPTRWIAIRDPAALITATRSGRCVVWAHTSMCESDEARQTCTAIERAVHLEALASTDLPAVPSADPYPYDTSAVHISLHRARP